MGGAMKDLDTSVKESLTAQSSDHIADAGKVIAEPVKQESVALDEVRRIAAEYAEPNSQVDSGNLYWALCEALKYTAPVDAKAIRAEALEEAAKWFEEGADIKLLGHAIAAAIRELKKATGGEK